MPASREIDWVTIRTAYEETTEPVAAIAGRFGIWPVQIYNRARLKGWKARNAAQAERQQAARVGRRDAPDLSALVISLQRTTARVVMAMEARLGAAGEGISEADLKALGALATTLSKVISLQPQERTDGDAPPAQTPEAGDDQDMLDELVTLADRFVRARTAGTVPEEPVAADAALGAPLLADPGTA